MMILHFEDGLWLVLTISEKNSEGKTLAPTPRSATAREMIKALVLVRSRRLLQTRKIMEPFPAAATMDNVQPRIVNQVSIEENRTTSAYVQLGADGKKHSFCYFWLKTGGATKSNCDQQIC